MSKKLRENLDPWVREGFVIEAVEPREGDHFRVVLRLPDGRRVATIATSSRSCTRARLNTRARARRALRGQFGDGVTLLGGAS